MKVLNIMVIPTVQCQLECVSIIEQDSDMKGPGK